MKYLLLITLSAILLTQSIRVSATEINLIPMPQQLSKKSHGYTIDASTRIVALKTNEFAVNLLRDYLASVLGAAPDVTGKAPLSGKAIAFRQNDSLEVEAYKLSVGSKGITIDASSGAGWFYGVQTLKQLMEFSGGGPGKARNISVPGVEILDGPRFPWRAFMLDESRYFKGKKTVKLLLDEMARLKMNVFHWHLVDDQGWRIEIKKYPLLTEVGSIRESTQVGPLKWDSPMQSGEVHQGFYTQDEIREIVQYASERYITIVPEIEMPGHSSAAIAAYSWLGTSKEKIEVPAIFGVGKDVYDVTSPEVFTFLTDVLDEVMEIFPSKVIHIGGDEVKYDHWKNSEKIRDYMIAKNIDSPAELQVHFTNKISQYLKSKNRRMMGWNEILGHNLHEYQDEADTKVNQKLADGSVVHFWKGDLELATSAAKDGFDIVNSIHTSTYLDYDYEAISLKKSYDFDPVPEGLAPELHDKIIGSGCQMWSEWIPTVGELHYMVFPRIAAYAEVGWTMPETKDYSRFQIALNKLKEIWREKKIYFAEKTDLE